MKFKKFKFKKVKSTNNTAIRIIKSSNYRYGMVISPGDGDQYFTGGIGHFYMFWEANTGKVGYDKMQETMNTSNSGSANIYYTT